MFSKILVGSVLAIGIGVLIPACASISESECLAGNWADIGYRDGVNGKSRSVIADYVQTCGEHGADVDRVSYLESFETGLTHYCTYDKGFERGRGGSSYNAVCDGPLAAEFLTGYDDGYAEYELRRRYAQYEEDIDETEQELYDVKSRLADPAIVPDEKDRLRKKKKRIARELEDLQWEFRRFKREYDLDW